MPKASLKTVLETHEQLCNEARDIISIKGSDYNRNQQAEGDTLFNMRVSSLVGITDTPTQGVLVRISDKIMRLASLTKSAGQVPAVKDESVKDTIRDTINYLVYLYILYNEINSDTTTITPEMKELIEKQALEFLSHPKELSVMRQVEQIGLDEKRMQYLDKVMEECLGG